jgi:hypothetical protein
VDSLPSRSHAIARTPEATQVVPAALIRWAGRSNITEAGPSSVQLTSEPVV